MFKISEASIKAVVFVIIILILPFQVLTLSVFGLQSGQNPNSNLKPVALVLGAGVNKQNGKPTEVLAKRLEKTLELYNSRKISAILVSGDNRTENYNEPKVMKNYLVAAGVPENKVFEDFAGRRTFDSCYRAKNVFKTNKVIVVTQAFHIPRSVFLCKNQGLEVEIAIAQDSSNKISIIQSLIREVPATFLAIFQTVLEHEAPVKSDGSEADLSNFN